MNAPATTAGQNCCAPSSTDRGLADYNARRTYAYTLGEELALERKISTDAYLFLYKELVRLCKERAFCWPGLDWLAKRLSTSIGTIKRWMEELVSAALIRRKPRPGGLTTLTIVPALDAYDAGQVMPNTGVQDQHDKSQMNDAIVTTSSTMTRPLFFVPEQGITCDPPEGAQLIRQTVKRQKIKSDVVGCSEKHDQNESSPTKTAVTEALEAAGLTDPTVINELQGEPLNEIQAIIRYVQRQQHIDNPPGLIVALARNKAGNALCRTSKSRGTPPFQVPPSTPTVIKGVPMMPGVNPQTAEQIREQLQKQIAPDVWSVWFTDFHVLDITEQHMVVGVPNCLARDYVERQYIPTVCDAGAAVLGRRMTVELVIDMPR